LVLEQYDYLISCTDYCTEVIRIIRETLHNPQFQKFLEIILSIGNFQNKFPAKGFDLNFLFTMDSFILNDGSSLLSYCKNIYRQMYPGQNILLYGHRHTNLKFSEAIKEIGRYCKIDRRLGEEFVQKFEKITSVDFKDDFHFIGQFFISKALDDDMDKIYGLFTGSNDILHINW